MLASQALVLDLLEWIAAAPREYEAVMEAWRTSCPRMPVWEDAMDSGLVERLSAEEKTIVQLTQAGRDMLSCARP